MLPFTLPDKSPQWYKVSRDEGHEIVLVMLIDWPGDLWHPRELHAGQTSVIGWPQRGSRLVDFDCIFSMRELWELHTFWPRQVYWGSIARVLIRLAARLAPLRGWKLCQRKKHWWLVGNVELLRERRGLAYRDPKIPGEYLPLWTKMTALKRFPVLDL